MDSILHRVRANFSLLSLTTPEESRVEVILARVAQATKRKLFRWSITTGIQEFVKAQWVQRGDREPNPGAAAKALAGEANTVEVDGHGALLALIDFDPYLKDPIIVRSLRDALLPAKEKLITGIFVGAQLNLPPELQREVAEVELPLPTPDELAKLVEQTCVMNEGVKGLIRPEGDSLARLVESARGLTTAEVENALALSIVAKRQLDPAVVSAEKARAVKTSGALEILKPPAGGLDAVGGLAAVKDWIRTRGKAFTPAAKAYGLPNPKGALLLGIQGCGKSLAAKAASIALGVPCLRLDLGAVFGGLVGQSEAQMRAALRTIDAVAPCVVMIDELEKAFAGSGAGKSHDGGTSSRVLGHFLTWTQEHESPVFLIATANDVTALPPELLRRGRWDTLMFVDLPDVNERVEIFKIHLATRGRDVEKFNLKLLADTAGGYSGAELEQCIVDALFEAFADGGREITTDDVLKAITTTVPLSRMMSEQIDGLRNWAATRCVPANGRVTGKDSAKAASAGRRVAVESN